MGQEHLIPHLQKVHAVVQESTKGRVLVDKPVRALVRGIANPLKVGELRHDADHFVLGNHWHDHFKKKVSEAGKVVSVQNLREWIDQPRAMGLPKEAQNLVILAYAEQNNYTFMRHNVVWDTTLTNLPDDCELRQQQLPDEGDWNVAVERAGSIFGLAPSPLLKASNVSTLSAGVKAAAADRREVCVNYCQCLRDRFSKLGTDAAEANRMKTASATLNLIEKLNGIDTDEVVAAIAKASIPTTEAAMGECLGKAAQLTGIIDAANWDIFDAIGELSEAFRARADAIRDSVGEALVSDEHVVALSPILKQAQAQALRLITDATKVDVAPVSKTSSPSDTASEIGQTGPPTAPPKISKPEPGRRVVDQGSKADVDLDAAEEIVRGWRQSLKDGQSIRISISWIIEEGEGPS